MSKLANAHKLFDQLKAADSKNDTQACKRLLSSLKLLLVEFSSTVPSRQ